MPQTAIHPGEHLAEEVVALEMSAAELGLPNPEQELLKANLMLEVFRAIKARKLTQANAGTILGVPQPHVSDLMRGRARAFSAERLMQFLAALGHDVEIRVKRTRKERGQVSVVAAAS